MFAAAAVITTLTWIAGSSVKVEQIVGDCDYTAQAATGQCKPTTSRTLTRARVLGNDIGYSFEDNGKLLFLFGDTIHSVDNYHAGDTIASSVSTDPAAGLFLDFFTNPDGSPFFPRPPGVVMGAGDVPSSGIHLDSGTFVLCNTGTDQSLPDPKVHEFSVLTRFDETSRTFTTGRTVSSMPSGHFIITALHASGSDVMMFGTGAYRASDVYLAKIPASTFESGAGTRYFAGLAGGQPVWTASESAAVPVVSEGGSPSIGNVSVVYSKDLGLWLMTYDGGRQSQATTGVYFTYAIDPWGPWSTPQLIFNPKRDHALGVFIHDPTIVPSDGLNGPTIGENDIYTTRGAAYAPLMIERFTRVNGNTLSIYYTLSTWNPYTVVEMRSDFAILRAARHHAAKH